LTIASPAHAVITRLTPLKDVIEASHFIVTAKVDALDPDKPAMVLNLDKDYKGKAEFRRMPMLLKGDSEAEKEKQTSQLLKRLDNKLTLLLFITKREKQYLGFAYTSGTWFQFIGRQAEDSEAIRWSFTHCEPYLRRTFKGSTAELRLVVKDALEGTKEPPKPNEKEPPGLGPEFKKGDADKLDGTAQQRATGGPVFGVIPVLIGGPLAILGMLFPAVFGGLSGQMKRWTAFLSVISINSTLVLVSDWLSTWFSWMGNQATMWLVMSLVTVAGVLWAWRRHVASTANGSEPADSPRNLARVPGKGEFVTLAIMSIFGVGVVVYCLTNHQSLLVWPWNAFLALLTGIWAGTAYAFLVRLTAGAARRVISAEGVILWAMAIAFVALATTLPRGTAAVGGLETGEATTAQNAMFKGVAWSFTAPDKGRIDSSPLVAGDRVYVAAAHDDPFAPYGAIYCLERATGKVVWTFNDDKEMKQVFSSPCLADGKLYVGEGYHQDKSCKLYCLDATSGKKVWAFATESHTESSPCVVMGRVFCGAGDDGVYCLDAVSGKKVWQFPGVHVDAGPVVVGKRLYAGSGIGDVYRVTRLFCLDIDTGKPIWNVEADLPAWGSPSVAGRHVYFPLGNGNFIESEPKPAGALLCLDADTGAKVWRYDARDGVLGKPVVDQRHVYFGSRDENCYCVTRKEGKLVWSRSFGSPVLAAPALALCGECGHATGLYVSTRGGMIYCVQSSSGAIDWSFSLEQDSRKQPQLFSTPAVRVQHDAHGEHRQLFVGAGLQTTLSWSASLYCLEDELGE
jgi:outer membrane protein assembly factor BamB